MSDPSRKRHSAPSSRRVEGVSMAGRRRSSNMAGFSNEQHADSMTAAAVVAQEMNNVQTLKRLSLGALSTLDPDLPQFSSLYDDPHRPAPSTSPSTSPQQTSSPMFSPSGLAQTRTSQTFASHSSPAYRSNSIGDNTAASDYPQTSPRRTKSSSAAVSSASGQAAAASRSLSARLSSSRGRRRGSAPDEAQPEPPADQESVEPGPQISSSHASQLLWVPAHVHPELAPQEWKSFVQQKVAEIRATVKSSSPSSLSNETSSEESSEDGSRAHLSRKNTRLSREIQDQEEFMDASEVLEERKRKSRATTSTIPDNLTSISSLSAQLESLGELESLAMDPFQLVRSLSHDNSSGFYRGNNASVGIGRSASTPDRVNHSTGQIATIHEMEPLANDSDMPILQASSPSLRRSTNTRYSKPSSVRRGRRERPNLSRVDTSRSETDAEKPGLDSPFSPTTQHGQLGAPFSPEEPSSHHSSPSSGSSSSGLLESPLEKGPGEENLRARRSLKMKHLPERARQRAASPTIVPPDRADSLQQQDIRYASETQQDQRAAPRQPIDDDHDELLTESELPLGSLSLSSGIASPSMIGGSTNILSSIPLAGGEPSRPSANDSTGRVSASQSTGSTKQRGRKNTWKWLFNSGEGAEPSSPDSASVTSASTDSPSPVERREDSESLNTSERKTISSFFSKKKSKKEEEPSSQQPQTSPTSQKSTSPKEERDKADRSKWKSVGAKARYRSKSRERRGGKHRQNQKSRQEYEDLQQELLMQQQQYEQQQQQQLQQQQQQQFQNDGSLPYHIPPHQMSDKSLVMMCHRYPLHVERAIYRLSHLKLANPRRPLVQQVLLSNFMYAYLNLINLGYQQQMQQMHMQQMGPEEQQAMYGYDGYNYEQGEYQGEYQGDYQGEYQDQNEYRSEYQGDYRAEYQGEFQEEYAQGYEYAEGQQQQQQQFQQQQQQPQQQHFEYAQDQRQAPQQQAKQQSQKVPKRRAHGQSQPSQAQGVGYGYQEDEVKKSPSTESTSSSSSSSSIEGGEDLWHGEDEVAQDGGPVYESAAAKAANGHRRGIHGPYYGQGFAPVQEE